MFDMYDLSDLPNKVTYCNWRIIMVFNGTENYKLSHNYNIVNFVSTRSPKFPIVAGEWATLNAHPAVCVVLRIYGFPADNDSEHVPSYTTLIAWKHYWLRNLLCSQILQTMLQNRIALVQRTC